MFVGDVTSHQLQNLKPGTTYDLKVLAQYSTGLSGPLIGQGTTCKLITPFSFGRHTIVKTITSVVACRFYKLLSCWTLEKYTCVLMVVLLPPSVYLNVTDLTTYNVGYDSFCIRWAPHRAATSYRLKVNPFDSKYFCSTKPRRWPCC